MKKTLLFLAIILMTNIAFSQISFTDTLKNEYSNGDTIALPNNNDDVGDIVFLYVHNASSSEIEFTIEIVDFYRPDEGQNIYVCACGLCTWAQSQNQQVGGERTLAAQSYYSEESTDVQYSHLGNTEDAFITLKAINTSDPGDTAVLTLSTQNYVGVFEQKTQISKINIYPNPVSEILSINYTDVNQDFISIINSTGEIVQQTQINSKSGSVSINISELKQGIYFVKIGNESKKFIKRN